MRKLLLIAVLAAVLAAPASAYEFGYIALFADEARTTWCLETQDLPYAFDVYAFALPGENGMMAAEFSVSELASTYYLTDRTEGPLVSVSFGNVFTGISYSLILCRRDWVLLDVYHILATGPGQTAIWLEGHGDTGEISMADCSPGYPKDSASAYSSVFINYPPGSPECAGVATEESSWGAIKEMYE